MHTFKNYRIWVIFNIVYKTLISKFVNSTFRVAAIPKFTFWYRRFWTIFNSIHTTSISKSQNFDIEVLWYRVRYWILVYFDIGQRRYRVQYPIMCTSISKYTYTAIEVPKHQFWFQFSKRFNIGPRYRSLRLRYWDFDIEVPSISTLFWPFRSRDSS